MQRDSSVTPASDGGTVLDQYGAVAGADGGEDPVSTRGNRARAVRLVREHASDYGSEWTAMKAISGRLRMTAETVA